MSQANILYIHITASSSEVLKNLVLAGIRSTLFDRRPLQSTDPILFGATSNKASMQEAYQPAIQEMNPLIECSCIENVASVSELQATHLKDVSLVVASRITPSQAHHVRSLTSVPLVLVDCFGMHGASLFDWHVPLQYRLEVGKTLQAPQELKPISLERILQATWPAGYRFHQEPHPVWLEYRAILEHAEQHGWQGDWQGFDATQWYASLRHTVQLDTIHPTAQVSPVCAVVGGLVGNEVIKFLSGKGEPVNNALLFDGQRAWNYRVEPRDKGE